MNPELPAFLNAASHCAMQMMTNGACIKDHLHEVTMPAKIIPRIAAACESLVETKHDIIHEIFEIEESAAAGIPAERVDRILQWLFEPVEELHAIVQSLQFAAIKAPATAWPRCWSWNRPSTPSAPSMPPEKRPTPGKRQARSTQRAEK